MKANVQFAWWRWVNLPSTRAPMVTQFAIVASHITTPVRSVNRLLTLWTNLRKLRAIICHHRCISCHILTLHIHQGNSKFMFINLSCTKIMRKKSDNTIYFVEMRQLLRSSITKYISGLPRSQPKIRSSSTADSAMQVARLDFQSIFVNFTNRGVNFVLIWKRKNYQLIYRMMKESCLTANIMT